MTMPADRRRVRRAAPDARRAAGAHGRRASSSSRRRLRAIAACLRLRRDHRRRCSAIAAADRRLCIAFVAWEPDGDGYRTMYLVGPKGVLATHRQTHKPPGERFAAMPMGDEPYVQSSRRPSDASA